MGISVESQAGSSFMGSRESVLFSALVLSLFLCTFAFKDHSEITELKEANEALDAVTQGNIDNAVEGVVADDSSQIQKEYDNFHQHQKKEYNARVKAQFDKFLKVNKKKVQQIDSGNANLLETAHSKWNNDLTSNANTLAI